MSASSSSSRPRGKNRVKYPRQPALADTPFPNWQNSQRERAWREVQAPFRGHIDGRGGSRFVLARDDEQMSDASLISRRHHLFVDEQCLRYGDPHGVSKGIRRVSDIPVDDKVLFNNGSLDLSDSAMDFLRRLSVFIRDLHFIIPTGAYDGVLDVSKDESDDEEITTMRIIGDRPFPFIPDGVSHNFLVTERFTLGDRTVRVAHVSSDHAARAYGGQLLYLDGMKAWGRR